MGAAGGTFANAFANTLIHGQQVMAQIQDRREALDLQKKLTTAQLQAHDAQTQLATRKLKAMLELDQATQPPQWPDSELGPGGQQAPPPMDAGTKLRIAMGLDPESTAKALLMENQNVDLEKIGANWMGGGQAPAQAMPPPPPPPDFVPPTPQPSVQPQSQVPGAGGVAPVQSRSLSWQIGSDGKRKLNLQLDNLKLDIHTETVPLPDGRTQSVRRLINPQTGDVLGTTPVGAPVLPETMKKYQQIVQSWGGKPGTQEYESAIGDLAAADSYPMPEERSIAWDTTEKYNREVFASGQNVVKTSGSVREKAQAEKKRLAEEEATRDIRTAGGKTAAQEAAKTAADLQAPIGQEATRFLNVHDLKSVDPSMPKGKVYSSKDYVQIAPQQAQGIAYYPVVKETLEDAEKIILRNPQFWPASTGNASKDVGVVAQAWGKAKLQKLTNADLGRLDTVMITLPGVIKTFGDTANVAVAERAMTLSGMPLGAKTREQALAQIDELRGLLNASTARYGLPPIPRKPGPKPQAVPDKGEAVFDIDPKNPGRLIPVRP